MMLYRDLKIHYKETFAMVHHHKYSLSDIEQMIPYERDAFLIMIKNHIEEQDRHAKHEQGVRYGYEIDSAGNAVF